MVVVSHLFIFLWKSFKGRCDSHESHLPLFRTIYFPIAPFEKQKIRHLQVWQKCHGLQFRQQITPEKSGI